MKYFKLTSFQKVQNNYLSWSENWDYEHKILTIPIFSRIDKQIHIKYRIDIQILGLIRCYFGLKINQNKLKSLFLYYNYALVQLKMNKKYQ